MSDAILEKPGKPRFKKGLLVALFLGVAMVYFPLLSAIIFYGRLSDIYNPILTLVEIPFVIVGIAFINKNYKISIALFVVYLVLVFINRPHLGFFSPVGWYFDSKYESRYALRIPEFILVAFILYGLNKANKKISVVSSLFLLIYEAIWLFSAHVYISTYSNYGAAFEFIAVYSELLLPLLLFICSLKPRYIRGSIKVIDGYMAVRLLSFVAGYLLNDHIRYLNLVYLINVCWMPLLTIFGLNAVLVFPIRFRELAKIFGWSVLVVGVVFAATAAQQSADENNNKSESDRDAYMNELMDNIQSWENAGFSQNFSVDAAQSMLNEGRISQKEYEWLIRKLVNRA